MMAKQQFPPRCQWLWVEYCGLSFRKHQQEITADMVSTDKPGMS